MSQKFNPLSGNFDLVLDKASEIKFDNTASGLAATTVQGAVDQLEAQILALPNPITYKGTWNASTNTPTLANTDTGKEGFLYQVNVAGTVNFGAGAISFDIGDKVVSNGSVWTKWDMTDAVSSVNGQVGAVVLSTTDVAEGTNQYFTNERAQDAVGAALTSTSTVTFTYNDPSNAITADVNDGSITNAKVATGIDAAKIGSGSVSNTTFGYLDATSSIQTQFSGVQTQFSGVTTQLATKVDKVTGDITKTTFAAANNVASPANVTGASFSNAVVRSFEMSVDAVLNATTPAYQYFTIRGIQRGSDWTIVQTSVGDNSGVVFSITPAGQLQYISANAAGFTSLSLSFTAKVVGV